MLLLFFFFRERNIYISNSFISSRIGCPPDIVNEEDHNVEDNEIPDFTNWTIPKVDTKNVYKISWAENTFHSAYKVRTVEQIFSTSKTHEKCCLFTKKNIGEFLASKKFSYLHIGMVQVAIRSPELSIQNICFKYKGQPPLNRQNFGVNSNRWIVTMNSDSE